MDCPKVQEAILEALTTTAPLSQYLEQHVAGCATCARFSAHQIIFDSRLSAMFTPSEPSPSFRSTLWARVRLEQRRAWMDAMPDLVHLAGCGIATATCAFVLPFDTAGVFMAGLMSTSVSYLLLGAVRSSFEDSHEDHVDVVAP
jgi:hypothetical protein